MAAHVKSQMLRIGLLYLMTSAAALPAAPIDFVRDVQPIFRQHCYECHGAEKQKNDYRLDIKQVALSGGEHHSPNIVPGKAGASPLYLFVSRADPELAMPPEKRLSEREVAV